MKYTTLAIAATTFLSTTSAFPRMTTDQLKTYHENSKKSEDCPFAQQKKKRDQVFNAEEQLVDVHGEHQWVQPGSGDQRGPCPGLNALANHGYLPHNGVADMGTIINAVHEVYGMAIDLGGFLAVFGTVFDGSPFSLTPGYSIGGPTPNEENILGGLGVIGTPEGLSGSHNKYEADTSPTRDDLYVTGNNYHVDRSRFIDYWNRLPRDTPAPQQVQQLASFHAERFQDSVSQNPYFFYSPFAGVLVSPAGYSFPPRMMSNHSEEYKDGYLSPENLASFFGVQGTDPSNFVVNQGWERIPDNWYKRPLEDEFTIPDFLEDVIDHGLQYPELLSIGGNTGAVNTFEPIDLGDLTGGVFNVATLTQGNNLECFVFQSIMAAGPDFIGNTFSDAASALTPLADKIMDLIWSEACPQLYQYNQQLFNKFPGSAQAYNGYSGYNLQQVTSSQGVLNSLQQSNGTDGLGSVANVVRSILTK